jgi:hypothetical protein
VPYLEEAEDGYDAALVGARDRLARLADRVAAEGRDYTTDRVRLHAEHLTVSATDAEPWPEGVPLPPETPAEGRSSRLPAPESEFRSLID